MIPPVSIPASLALTPTSPTYVRSGVAYNYAIGGLPFFSAASEENPIARLLAPYRKQQFDNSLEPGEQSLDGWWLRSQMAYHHGAGQLYGDPGARGDDADPFRFHSSFNADVWTAGQATLLRSTLLQVGTHVPVQLLPYVDPTHGDAVFGVTASKIIFQSLTGGRSLAEANPSATDLQSCAFDGTTFYVSAKDGIWSRSITAFGGAWTKIWNIGTLTNVIGFAKRRLVLATSSGVYELTGAGPALPTAKYVPSPLGVTPTGIAEAGNAIFVSMHHNSQSEVIRFTLDATGGMPTLSGGALAARLPTGETIRSLYGYLDRYLLIGTSLGARVAAIDDEQLEYGPLLFSSAPVLGWTAQDRFAWCTVSRGQDDGSSGLYRIDLSVDLGNLRFAYAADLVVDEDVTDTTAVAHAGVSDRKYVVTSAGIFVEEALYAETGWVQSSRIRFGTLEPKVYKLVRVRGPALAAAAAVAIVSGEDSVVDVAGWAAGIQPGAEDYTVPLVQPCEYLSVRLTLTADTPRTATAQLNGWQLKALPATPRQTVIRLPLFCFDFEKDRYGVRSGAAGAAFTRLRALFDLARNVDVVSFQDLDGNVIERCIVDDLQFMQTAPPTGSGGWGGIVTVTLRTV